MDYYKNFEIQAQKFQLSYNSLSWVTLTSKLKTTRSSDTWHPSFLIDLKLKGHLHCYKLHQIFQFFMGFHMVPLLKRMVWLKFLYIQKTDELLLETVECSDWWKIYFYKKILYKRKSCKGFFCKNKFSTNKSTQQLQEIVHQIFEYIRF